MHKRKPVPQTIFNLLNYNNSLPSKCYNRQLAAVRCALEMSAYRHSHAFIVFKLCRRRDIAKLKKRFMSSSLHHSIFEIGYQRIKIFTYWFSVSLVLVSVFDKVQAAATLNIYVGSKYWVSLQKNTIGVKKVTWNQIEQEASFMDEWMNGLENNVPFNLERIHQVSTYVPRISATTQE